MNFTLYPIYWVAGPYDDEPFTCALPFPVTEGVCIVDMSGRFREDEFDLHKEKMGTERLGDLRSIRYALVHRYVGLTGYPLEEQSDEMVLMLAACLRLIRPMRQNTLLMRGIIRDEDGTFDVRHFELPAPYLVDVPEVQKLFKLRNRDADSLRTYASEFLRAMRGGFWKFRMAVQFHDLGHFQTLDPKARFLLWCSAIESIYTSRHWEHKGSQVAKARIKWFIGDKTSIYGPGDISKLLEDPQITVGQIVGDLYDVRNYIAHGDKLPDGYFHDVLRASFNGGVVRLEVLFEAASFIVRSSLLKILHDNLLDHFIDAGPAEAFFAQHGLTRTALRSQ